VTLTTTSGNRRLLSGRSSRQPVFRSYLAKWMIPSSTHLP
jgi:hypothetical protein